MSRFQKIFKEKYPTLAMLHLKGENDRDVLDRAKREIEVYYNSGMTGVIVENYFGNYNQMELVLSYLKENYSDHIYGVNCLNMDVMGFELAIKYDAKFVQLDSIVGHVKPRDEYSFQAFIDLYKRKTDVLILGGVRFKYQPVLSENSLEKDLQVAMSRCDAIVVTGTKTGEETSIEKIKEFKSIVGDFPLIVGAGVTPENCKEQMSYASGAILGSYLKENHIDSGEVSKKNVKEISAVFNEIRREK